MEEEKQNLNKQKMIKTPKIAWFGLGLTIVTSIINWLMMKASFSEGTIMIFGPIMTGFNVLATILIPLGLILFFLKWSKSKKIKIITFLVFLPLILISFSMTFYGRFIVTPAYRGVIGIITSPIEEKALQTGDVNKCQQIPEWTNREQCIKTLAITEKNESFCELMKSTGINNCFIEVAKLKKDSKICENPKLESSYRNNCYQSVFIVSESVCKDFENERFAFSNEREECLKNIAVERRDISMCKFLEWDTKRACEQEIQKQ